MAEIKKIPGFQEVTLSVVSRQAAPFIIGYLILFSIAGTFICQFRNKVENDVSILDMKLQKIKSDVERFNAEQQRNEDARLASQFPALKP